MPTLFDIPAAPPPSVAHSPTSRAAATAIEPAAHTLRWAVLDCLRFVTGGLTDEEIQEQLSMPSSTERPRRCELVKAGLVIDSGRTRLTRAGRRAAIWVAVNK